MPKPRGVLERLLVVGITATCEGLFPVNDLGAPDFRDAEMVERTRRYLRELPPAQRRLVSLLFMAVEFLAPLLLLVPRRFSRLTPGERALAVRRFRLSRFFPVRVLGDALKASTTMIYMSHPRVVAYVGEHRACARAEDPLSYPVRPAALPRHQEGA